MASTDARPVPRKNVAYRVTFPILDADGDLVTGATGLDSEVSIDGGTFADATSEATEIATASGMYFLDLTAAEMNGDTIALIVKTSSAGAKTTPLVFYPEEVGDFRADVVQISGDTAAADSLETMLDGTGGNVLTLAQLRINATSANGAIDIDNSGGVGIDITPAATTVGVNIKGGATSGSAVVLEAQGGGGHGLHAIGATSGAGIRAQAGATGSGVHATGGSTSGAGALVTTTDGHGINVTTGGAASSGLRVLGSGTQAGVTVQGGATGHGLAVVGGSTSGNAVDLAATDGDGLEATGGGTGVDIDADITGNITGNLSGSVGSVTGAVGSVSAGGITAASIATGAVDADALSADAVAEIADGVWDEARVGHVAAGSFGEGVASVQGNVTGTVASVTGAVGSVGAGGITAATLAADTITAAKVAADVGTELADALLDRDMATGTDSGSTTVRTVRQALRFLRNKWALSGTTLTVNKEDDITASWTSTVTATAGADPITASDPAGP